MDCFRPVLWIMLAPSQPDQFWLFDCSCGFAGPAVRLEPAGRNPAGTWYPQPVSAWHVLVCVRLPGRRLAGATQRRITGQIRSRCAHHAPIFASPNLTFGARALCETMAGKFPPNFFRGLMFQKKKKKRNFGTWLYCNLQPNDKHQYCAYSACPALRG